MTKFKNPMQQRAYAKVQALAAAGKMPNRFFGSLAEAYWNGRNGTPRKYLRSSVGYAAFAAGRDDRRAAERRTDPREVAALELAFIAEDDRRNAEEDAGG